MFLSLNLATTIFRDMNESKKSLISLFPNFVPIFFNRFVRKHLIFFFNDSRLLIVTPSNSASDLVTERLIASGHVGKRDLVRLNAFQVSFFYMRTNISQGL